VRFTQLYAQAIRAKRRPTSLWLRPEEENMNDRPLFSMSRRRWLAVCAFAVLGLVAAGVATAAPGWFGHGRHGFGHHRGGSHGGHDFSAEDIRSAVEWMLREADASDEQVARVSEIATAAANDLRGLRDQHDAQREAFAAALVGADRAALETLRGDGIAAADAASQRLVAALADAAEVLTPEQRQQLAEAHARHHGRD
jgi:Spy/CpxP family protein refolding chaperone